MPPLAPRLVGQGAHLGRRPLSTETSSLLISREMAPTAAKRWCEAAAERRRETPREARARGCDSWELTAWCAK